MKLKLIFFFMLIIFSLMLVKADAQLPDCVAGGDDQLVISCLGDSELIFLGSISPTSIGGLHVGIGPESTNISSKTKVVIPEKDKKPLILYFIIII